MAGRGRRRAGADNVILRQKLANLTDDLAWYRRRLMDVNARCRALRAQAEIADGERLRGEQVIHRQTAQLIALDAENERLRRQLKAASDDTVETPVHLDGAGELSAV